jgi:hypothetical protein
MWWTFLIEGELDVYANSQMVRDYLHLHGLCQIKSLLAGEELI